MIILGIDPGYARVGYSLIDIKSLASRKLTNHPDVVAAQWQMT